MKKIFLGMLISFFLAILLIGCEGAFDSRFSIEKSFVWQVEEEPFSKLDFLIHSRNGNITLEPVQGRRGQIEVKMHVKAASLEEAQTIADEQVALITSPGILEMLIEDRRINASIYAEIPAYFEYDLDLKTTSGGIALEGLVCNKVSMQSKNGPLELNQVKVDELKGYTSNGSLKLTDIQAQKINLETSNSEIYFSGQALDSKLFTSNAAVVINLKPYEGLPLALDSANLVVETTNGNIEVLLPKANELGFNVQARSDEGEVRFDMLGFTSLKTGVWQTRNFYQASLKTYLDLRTSKASIIVDED